MARRKALTNPQYGWGFVILVVGFFALVAFMFIRILPQPISTSSDTSRTSEKTRKSASEQARNYFGDDFSGAVFIPYWSMSTGDMSLPAQNARLDTLLYFGITPTKDGIDMSEPGYTTLPAFVQSWGNSDAEKLLTIRMMNEDISGHILENPSSAEKVIEESLSIAQEYGFDGILLDLEHSVLPTKKITDLITSFVRSFSDKAATGNMSFSAAIYGDTYYRSRPYNIAAISDYVDTLYIMAYDFHKSYGEPGPNFPLNASDASDQADPAYPYSFSAMLDDFLADTSVDNISVVFGMFGYNWTVDDQNRPVKSAEAVTLNQARTRYLSGCDLASCTVLTDPVSAESHVTFRASDGSNHSVWFETEQSVAAKTEELRKAGVSRIGFWAYGYY